MAAAGIPYGGNPSLTISYYQLSLNNNTPAQPGNQPPTGRGQAYQSQNRGGGGGRGADRGRGRGRGRGRSDDDSSDRGSMSGVSVRTTGGSSDNPRTFHFDPCNCSVTTRVTPSTAYCPVCGDPCTGVTVERDGTFTDFTGADDTIEEEPSNDDDTQQQTHPNVVPQPRSLPQPGPPVQNHVTGTPQPISLPQNSPPQAFTTVSPIARNDASQQMKEVENAQAASLVSRGKI
ncbi:hypothetical protein FS837_010968 [Tulasnella sp. UAMH 9824]|nr:hypothetical protein FS837_010968 [Tulasnella sp. UAMH 9824]